MSSSEESLLELEHVVGFTGKYAGTSLCHPTLEGTYITALGAHVVIADIYDPHKQTFLKGHDADVSTLDVSASGRFLASGQLKSPNAPAGDAMIVMWDYSKQKAIYNFFGITGEVMHVKFSPDEKFLAAAGADMHLYVWDLATGEQVFGKKQGSGDQSRMLSFLSWGPVTTSPITRRPSYTLCFAIGDRVQTAVLEFDFRGMRYITTIAAATLPASGFSRSYSCGVVDPTGRMILAGTTTGEVAVYWTGMTGGNTSSSSSSGGSNSNASAATSGAGAGSVAAAVAAGVSGSAPSAMYKTALLASTNGVHCLLRVKGAIDTTTGRAAVYVGGGDGTVRCFIGKDMDWACTAEARLQGRVISMSIASTGAWMLVGTAAGHVYRVSFGGNLHAGAQSGRAAVDMLEASHTGPVLGAFFHPTAPDAVATVSTDHTLRLWNLNTYGVSWGAYTSGNSHPVCSWVTTLFEGGGGGGGGAEGGSNGSNSSNSSGASRASGPGIPCEIYCGYADGTLRAYAIGVTPESTASTSGSSSTSASFRDPSIGEAWRTNAHRGGVSCITGNRAIIITGGADGRVNIWSRRSHDLLLSFNDHSSRGVLAVAVDCRNPEIVYSVGADRIINTLSLRAERRVRQHALPQPETTACSFTTMSQLRAASSEKELMVATTDGRVFVYDPGIPDMHVGVIDVLALLTAKAKSSATAVGVNLATGKPLPLPEGTITVPKAKPGQARAEMRINAICVSPSGTYVALVTQCGRLIILEPGAEVPASAITSAANRHGTSTFSGTFTDLSGTVRPTLTSNASACSIAAFFHGASPYTDVRWAPDEKQLLLTASDACVSVFNWFGTELAEEVAAAASAVGGGAGRGGNGGGGAMGAGGGGGYQQNAGAYNNNSNNRGGGGGADMYQQQQQQGGRR